MARQALTTAQLHKRAEKMWRRLYGKKWPRGWHVTFAHCGYTDYACKEIVVYGVEPEDMVDTLAHEFQHLARFLSGRPNKKHGKKFWKEHRRNLKRLLRI